MSKEMSKELETLQQTITEELKKLNKKGELSPTELENALKATKANYYITVTRAMEEHEGEGEYSQRGGRGYSQNSYYMPMYHDGHGSYNQSNRGGSYDGYDSYDSYGRGSYDSYGMSNEHGMSNAGRRGRDGDGDGQYSERRGRGRDGRYVSRDGGSYGYSGHNDKMMENLNMMLQQADNEQDRQAIRQCMEKLGQ